MHPGYVWYNLWAQNLRRKHPRKARIDKSSIDDSCDVSIRTAWISLDSRSKHVYPKREDYREWK